MLTEVFIGQSDQHEPQIPVSRGKGLFLLMLLGDRPSPREVRAGQELKKPDLRGVTRSISTNMYVRSHHQSNDVEHSCFKRFGAATPSDITPSPTSREPQSFLPLRTAFSFGASSTWNPFFFGPAQWFCGLTPLHCDSFWSSLFY